MKKRLFSLWFTLLAFIAGYFNLVGVWYFKMPTSHHTGNLTNLVLSLSKHEWGLVSQYLLAIACFVLGSMATRCFSKAKQVTDLSYGDLNLYAGVLVGVFEWGFGHSHHAMIAVIAYVMGLQNAIRIHHKGYLVRTSHMTGNIADLGVLLVASFSGRKDLQGKLMTVIVLILAFLIGGFSAVQLGKFRVNLIYIGAILYLLACMLYKSKEQISDKKN